MSGNRKAIRHQRHGEVANKFNRRLTVDQLRFKFADGQRLAVQTGAQLQRIAVKGNVLNGGRQAHIQFALPLLPGGKRQFVDSQPAIWQHRLPFRQRARRAGSGFAFREFAQTGRVDVQRRNVQPPAARM
ncbi:Uncharacterised protein [Yokenella regensburgei]|nr:Uncharacterised protein [Yokenella regensburgei]